MSANLNPTIPPLVPASSRDLSSMSPASAARWQHLFCIFSDGPSHSDEWLLHEILQFFSSSTGYTTISFDTSALWLASSLLKSNIFTHTILFSDIFNLITLLPIRHGEVVEKKLLLDLVLAAEKELGMRWWCELEERMAVFLGIMLAGLILRRVGSGRTEDEDELVSLMGQVDLSMIRDAEVWRIWR
jgi:hypothetical protein